MAETLGKNGDSILSVNGKDYQIYRLETLTDGHVNQLPYCLKILLENLLRPNNCRTRRLLREQPLVASPVHVAMGGNAISDRARRHGLRAPVLPDNAQPWH